MIAMTISNIEIGYDATRKLPQCKECKVIIIFENKPEIIALDKNLKYAEKPIVIITARIKTPITSLIISIQ